MNPIDSSKLPLPPGQFGLPVIGETLKFFRDSKFAQKRHQQHGMFSQMNKSDRSIPLCESRYQKFLITASALLTPLQYHFDKLWGGYV